MTEPSAGSGSQPAAQYASGIRIAEVRVQDFRVLRDACIPLSPDTTVLIGENNTGKTSLLIALAMAIEGRVCTEDELHLTEDGARSSRSIVDIKIVPAVGTSFDADLVGLFGEAIQPPEGDSEFVTIRTEATPNPDGSGLGLRRRFVQGWSCEQKTAAALPELERPRVRRPVLDLLSFFILDARRDIVSELQNRTSSWGRLVSDLDIDPALKEEFEASLASIGDQIVAGSSVLERLRSTLELTRRSLASGVGSVAISPLPARIDELARGIDVLVTAPGSASVPMRLQGMGGRSLASLMVFRAFVDVRVGADRTVRPLAVSAFEEPEAHLHPHAQQAVFSQLADISGQKIVSTHSPHVASVSDILDVRVFRRVEATVEVRQVQRNFSEAELTSIRRFVLKRHPDMLFARLVVLVEGEDEHTSLPVFARTYWDDPPFDALGLSIVNVDGAGGFKAIVPVLEDLGIPWLIFVDGDQAGQDAVRGVGNSLGRPLDETSPEVVMLPRTGDGQDFEKYLVGEGFRPEIEAAIASYFDTSALDDFRKDMDGTQGKGGVVRDYQSAGWEDRLVVDFLRHRDYKARYGVAVASSIITRLDTSGRPSIPVKVRELFDRSDQLLGASGGQTT